MPEKKDQRKVMNVLEKMGMVRKLDDEPIDVAAAPQTEQKIEIPEQFWEEESDVQTITAVPVLQPAPVVAQTSPLAANPAFPETVRAIIQEELDNASYVDKFMEVNSLYQAFSMRTGGTDTIYLIEEYMKSLPDSLPAESRRSIIMKIIGASGFDFEHLVGDGIDRVNKLNDYANQFARRTDDYIEQRNQEIEDLENRIDQLRGLMDKRRTLHKQQFFVIDTEAQRLKEILDFITK